MRISVPVTWVLALAVAPSLGQNFVQNPGFDTDVEPWKNETIPGATESTVTWSSVDASGSPASGSAEITALTATVFGAGIWQVVRVVPRASYDISAKLNVESPPGGDAWLDVLWYSGDPQGNYLYCNVSFMSISGTSKTVLQNTWETVAATVVAPNSAGCARVRVAKSHSGPDPHRVRADDVVFRRTGTTGSFHTVTPCRLVDTHRTPGTVNGGPALFSTEARNVQIGGNCDIPVDATAVAANLTVVDPTGGGHLQAFPAAEAAPTASALNFHAGVTKANFLVMTLGPDGWGTIGLTIPGGGAAHVLLDVTGWYR